LRLKETFNHAKFVNIFSQKNGTWKKHEIEREEYDFALSLRQTIASKKSNTNKNCTLTLSLCSFSFPKRAHFYRKSAFVFSKTGSA